MHLSLVIIVVFVLVLNHLGVFGSNLTMIYRFVERKKNFYVDCIASNTDSAIAWYTTDEYEGTIDNYYIRDNVNYLTSQQEFYITPLNWWSECSTSDSSDLKFGYITDERWQDLRSYTTSYTAGSKLSFAKVDKIELKDPHNFEIPFSLQSNGEAHLFLCEKDWNSYSYNYCYWFIFRGWGGIKSLIRRCYAHSIPSENVGPFDKECTQALDIVDHKGANDSLFKLDAKSWLHFTLVRKNRTISIIHDNKVFLSYYENEEDIRKYRYIILNSRDKLKNSIWKIHNYTFFKTTTQSIFSTSASITTTTYDGPKSICLSLFVYMCPSCTLSLILQKLEAKGTNDVEAQETFRQHPEKKWAKIKFIVDTVEHGSNFIVLITTKKERGEDNPFWAVDRFRECEENEMRSSSLITRNQEGFCYLLEESNVRVDMGNNPSSSFSKSYQKCNNHDQFGRSCLPCKAQSDHNICRKSIICEINGECYCSPGYEGRYCKNRCESNRYGYGCLEQCGNCNFQSCNNVDGLCENGCLEGYAGDFCKKGTQIQNVISSSTENSISLKWSPPVGVESENLSYEVHLQHDDYLECRRSLERKKHVGEENITDTLEHQIAFNNLIPRSRYRINITTYSENKKLGATLLYVETKASVDSIFELPFPEISIADINDKSIRISISDLNCTMLFYPVQYFLQIKCTDLECEQKFYTKCYNHSEIWESKEVKPFSNYTWFFSLARADCVEILKTTSGDFQSRPRCKIAHLIIICDELTMIWFSRSKEFRLAVYNDIFEAPGQIVEFYIYAFSKTKISLRWSNPNPANGVLERYAIKMTGDDSSTQNIISDNISKCKIWPNMNCFDWIASWKYKESYQFDISAWNYFVDKAVIKSIGVYFKPNDLKPPKNLTVKYSDDNRHLYLQWMHPDMVSGEYVYFVIYINGTSYNVAITEFNQTYYYTVRDSFMSLKELHISVLTMNNYNKSSKEIKESIIVPPKIPILVEQFKISKIKEEEIKLKIPELKHVEGDESYLLIIVSCPETDGPNIVVTNSRVKKLFKNSKLSDYKSWIAKEIFITQSNNGVAFQYNIGTNSSTKSKYIDGYQIVDRYLKGIGNLAVSVVLINKFLDYERSRVYTVYAENNSGNTSSGMEYIYILLAVVVLVVVGLLIYRYKTQKKTTKLLRRALSKILAEEDTTEPTDYNLPIRNGVENLILSNIAIDDTSMFSGTKVPMDHFEVYARDLICSKELEKEFNSVPKSEANPCTIGALPENKSKNRYGNLLPYDHSRVALKEINNDPFSTYINANFIQGYKSCKGYIATQGVKKSTTPDFWRMIWEQNATCIVMVTNCIENEKPKCFQYWPNNDSCLSAGTFQITHGYSVVFADYTERIMTVRNTEENANREVRHLHFTSWPDHGTPLYPQTLSPFIRVVNNISQELAPIVVHCSAGVGRTGTIILMDFCLRMAQGENAIAVSNSLQEMRENRSNLVGNQEQYELVYMVLLDMLFAPVSVIQCDATFLANVSNILKNNDHIKLYTYLNDIAWQDELYQSGRRDENQIIAQKNRFSKIIADDNFRVFLSPLDGATYINAVYVDGFKTQKQFIATQHPMKMTLEDFWRMVADTNCKTIISLEDIDLDDDTSCSYWPTETNMTMKPFKTINLEYKGTNDTHAPFDEIKVALQHKKVNVEITILHVKKWRKDLPHPTSKTLVMLWSEVSRKMIGTDGVIVVVCRDGAYRCGLFLAQCFLLEKIKLEHEFDACLATRVVRRSRPQFLKDIRQFQFLYQLAKTYYEEFETYSNFN